MQIKSKGQIFHKTNKYLNWKNIIKMDMTLNKWNVEIERSKRISWLF